MDLPENARSGETIALFDRLFPLWGVCAMPPLEVFVPKRAGTPLPAGARAVAMAAFPYLLPEAYYTGRNISRYAVVRNYHDVCGARLAEACSSLEGMFPGEAFAAYCGSSPLPEAALAEAAGIGRRGRHNLLITREYGSWVFLGSIVSTIELPANERNALPDGCGNCNRCRMACPAGALTGGFDRNRCLSHLSQKKDGLSPEEEALLRRSTVIWGCDICQEACPLSAGKAPSPLPEFLEEPLARLDRDTPLEGRAYAWRGRAVLERNLTILAERPSNT